MDRDRRATKSLFSNTQEGVTTQIQLRYNPRTEHIGVTSVFKKSDGFSNGSLNNKNCSNYLGITIAEQILAKIFKNVVVMPSHNKGFDIICNQGYKIDIKSATHNKKGKGWMFSIKHNKIADYFLCLAFDNREDLNPLHLWLIGGEKINHLSYLRILESRLNRWSQYELDDGLNKVIGCCNIMQAYKKPSVEPVSNIEYP